MYCAPPNGSNDPVWVPYQVITLDRACSAVMSMIGMPPANTERREKESRGEAGCGRRVAADALRPRLRPALTFSDA